MLIEDKNTQVMMSFYKEIFELKKESKKLYRDFKLNLLSDSNPIPNIKRIKKKNFFMSTKYWKILNDSKDYAIITGSLALKSFGFLDRNTSNVDLIIQNDKLSMVPNKITTNKIDPRYSDNYTSNMLGSFFVDKVVVDIYQSNYESVIEHEGLKFQNPYEILKNKLDLVMNDGSLKHFLDIKHYLTQVNKTNTFLAL